MEGILIALIFGAIGFVAGRMTKNKGGGYDQYKDNISGLLKAQRRE